ncbi:LacI family transcriptional regulator [Gramella lutea]|uniref:LacI family transcriptional regulator n=1 Tax=Christiangramia lutea TaxID=1607951 RepID=A0A9X2AAC4_9FLAO|nr:LacI family DNA-binding transcriptional regulator [Christiangramia lutea]MCH4822417.1 LacI family transcriptional regulator [Christiangramia lutea]
MRKSTRLRDIAESLNLSVGTVSKALNNSSEISERTKERVQEVARLNHYMPNISARNLKGQRTRSIGVVLPSLDAKIYSDALKAIEERMNSKNYRLVLCISNESYKKEVQCIQRLIQSQVDGIIISPSIETYHFRKLSHLRQLKNFNTPLVQFDRVLDDLSSDKVTINQSYLVEKLTLQLYSEGYSKIGFVSRDDEECKLQKRKAGYLNALKAKSLQKIIFQISNYELDSIAKFVQEGKIDAIIVPYACLLAKIIEVFKKFEVVREIEIFCLEKTEYFPPSPQIKYFSLNGTEQGITAIDTLIDRIEGIMPAEPIEFELEPVTEE